jgi:hypothetical protein
MRSTTNKRNLPTKVLSLFFVGGGLLGCPKPPPETAAKIPLRSFEKDGRYGFRDVRGTVVIPAQYLSVSDFSSGGVAFVADDKGWSCIDTKNNVLLTPYLYDNGPDYVSEELFRYTENKKIGFADPLCKIVIQAEYDFAAPFEEGMSVVCNGCSFDKSKDPEHPELKGGTWGYIDKTGKLAIPMQYQSAMPFENGKATVTQNGAKVTIDKTGAIVP